MSLRVIIVEDNTEFVEQLRREIKRLFPNQFKVVGTAGTIEEAYKLISTTPADIVLFDIELPDGNGLHLVERLVKEKKHTFQFFFISSFDVRENLIKSYQLKSTYFVTKPLDDNELKEALSRTIENHGNTEFIKQIQHSLPNLEHVGTKISVEIGYKKTLLVPIDQIMFMKTASFGRTQFYLEDGQEIASSKSLKYYVNLFEERGFQFVKANRYEHVHINHIKETDTSRGVIILTNGHEIKISRRSKLPVLTHTRFFSPTKTEILASIQRFLQSFEINKE